MTEQIKGELAPKPDVEAKAFLDLCKDVLRSSPEFTQAALGLLVRRGTYLKVPSERLAKSSDGSTIVDTTTLLNAAADHVFSGRASQPYFRFRLGLDEGQFPEPQTYKEIETRFPSGNSIELKYRERQMNDKSQESMDAPYWSTLRVQATEATKEIFYEDGINGEQSTDPQSALKAGQILLDKIKEGI